ncbi:SDR family oxidoreductase [Pseudoxanthomonas putridarboris]|uniref:SDR family oxidoreductase n=1 Tax=Pseudoxanthomonas putridarboris TaxID=752605 RepID=A0ABU9J2I4_9GAMM
MKPNGNKILITGGASGIGLRLAQEFQKIGNQVIIAGRRQSLIDEVIAANPGITGYVLDIDDPQSIADFAAKVTTEHSDLNVLLNNAGIMKFEPQGDDPIDLAIAEATVSTNLLGPIRLIAALLPHLRRQSQSAIVNVSSGLAFVPLAVTPTYNATKAAIHLYTVSLRRLLRDTTVEVLELIPPSVQTGLFPGHAEDPNAMPLEDFIAETMAEFKRQPTPHEIKVKRVGFQRDAEAEGRFEQAFDIINGGH